MCASRPAEGGFTLLEAVVALAIVAVVSLATLSSLGAELRAAGRAREVLPAAALAEHRLAVAQLLRAEELATLPDSVARGRFAPPFEGYGWATEADVVLGHPGLYDLRVRVEWADGSFALHSRVYRPERARRAAPSAP